MKKLPEKLIDILKNNGYTVYETQDANGNYAYEIGKYTDEGQDFSFFVDFGEDIDDFCDNIYTYWEDFDADEEAGFWIGEDGHGKNGAPYRISDIVKDMEQAKQYILDCYNLLKEHKQ